MEMSFVNQVIVVAVYNRTLMIVNGDYYSIR